MNLIIYILSAVFLLMALALLFAYRRTRHYGVLLMGLVYGASAAAGLMLVHWWPLLAGYALVWGLKLMGLEPGPDTAPHDQK